MKKGTVTVGKKVIVMWEKSKKTYNALMLDMAVGVHSPPSPQQDTDDPLAFDLVAPATQTQAVDLPNQSQPMLHKRQEDEKLVWRSWTTFRMPCLGLKLGCCAVYRRWTKK